MKDSCRSSGGFTLAELLVAAMVLAIVLVGMLQLFIHCSFLAEFSKNKTIAVSIAQNKLEEIRNTGYTSIVSTFAPTCPCNDGLDNDGDGLTDYPGDAGCSSASQGNDTREDYECNDGIDNDGSGLVDFPADLGCSSLTDDDEGYLPSVDNGACTGTFTVSELNSATGSIAIDASNSSTMEVRVTVSWTNKGGRVFSVSMRSLMSRR